MFLTPKLCKLKMLDENAHQQVINAVMNHSDFKLESGADPIRANYSGPGWAPRYKEGCILSVFWLGGWPSRFCPRPRYKVPWCSDWRLFVDYAGPQSEFRSGQYAALEKYSLFPVPATEQLGPTHSAYPGLQCAIGEAAFWRRDAPCWNLPQSMTFFLYMGNFKKHYICCTTFDVKKQNVPTCACLAHKPSRIKWKKEGQMLLYVFY